MSTRTARTTTSRRTFLQRMAIGGLTVGPGSALIASCASPTTDDDSATTPEDQPDDVEMDADNPLGIDPAGELEVFIFLGGFQDQYATDVHQPLFAERWPGVEITHQADPDVAGVLQSRFVEGNPPDFVNNNGGQRIDPAVLVGNDQLYDLTELYDAPSWDDPDVVVRDTLLPGAVEAGMFGPTPYVLNYAYTLYGIWYNQQLFNEHGWTPPTTWAEMLDLCDEIQGAGVAPWTYQGGSPRYVNWPILTMAAKLAGPEILVDIDNLVPGAWEHDAIRESAAAMAGLREAGYILDGTEGMDHVQAQTAWAQGRAAFIGCGSWLENENADDIAANEGFQVAMMPEPLLSENSALPAEALRAAPGEPYVVPAQANSPQAGLEYMRAMLSQDRKSVV